jgi:hypothetical protein
VFQARFEQGTAQHESNITHYMVTVNTKWLCYGHKNETYLLTKFHVLFCPLLLCTLCQVIIREFDHQRISFVTGCFVHNVSTIAPAGVGTRAQTSGLDFQTWLFREVFA